MAELNDEIKDINNSLAFTLLEDLRKSGTISKAEMDLFKSKYAKLHETVVQTYENERGFLERAKQLNQRLMDEKIKLEKTTLESQEDQTVLQHLQEQNTAVKSELEVANDRDMMVQIQVSELEYEKREKQALLEERENERRAEAEPLLQRARDEIELLQKEMEMMNAQKENHQQKLDEYTARVKDVELDIEANRAVYKSFDTEYSKIKNDPDRIHKQAEKFESAVKALTESQKDRGLEIEASGRNTTKLTEAQKEVEEHRAQKHQQRHLLTEKDKINEQSCEDLNNRLKREKNKSTELLQKRLGLDQELKELQIENRQGNQELTSLQKQLEKLRRQYRRTQLGKEAVVESLNPLKDSKEELELTVRTRDEEIKRQRKLLEDIQGEVDLFIGAYLKQESLEKDKKDEYDVISQSMVEMQKELKALQAEEQKWAAEFKTLAAHRERLARDASTANRLCKATMDEVSMKELEEADLRKKYQEITLKQKEFCTMYEVVKNERNKYMTHIQKSSQHLSEMKEKLKILLNEVEILRMETGFKDKQLQRTRQEAQRLDVIHDQLQNEKTRITAKGAALNEQVEQYVIEIDKLNSIITSIEKEMVAMRKEYEQAVETRNFTGTQLIDRNDELCILWEKSNAQEKLLNKGKAAMLAREEEIRGLKIDLQEVQRQLAVVRRRIPEVPKLFEQVAELREQVSSVRKRSDELSRELENPKSSLRKWRKLGGEDLTQETLRVKIRALEERLNDKKESLLEKELVLEEVSALSEKLRQQAVDGRHGTMELSQKVNVFQSRIKDVTRKMMATVSELSMYQATAHKLERECDDVMDKSVSARERLRDGQPPTDTADAEFERMLQVEKQRERDRQAAIVRKQGEEIMNSNFTRTTAEPRVNAYIPEDEHGLPKAYGVNAPFKPSAQGATMRHIRKPNPKPIEI